MSVTALIAAAGRGSRVGGRRPKQFLPIGGEPMLAKTLAVFQQAPVIDHIVVIVPSGEEPYCREAIVRRYGVAKVRAVVAGGETRQASVVAGLQAVDWSTSIVLIHDAARPFVPEAIIARVVERARATGAAIAALPIVDTLKRSVDGCAMTVERDGLWAAQTPQAFRIDLLRHAVERAASDGFVGTDDASLVERVGHPVALVEGHPANIKITRMDDFVLADETAVSWNRTTGSSSEQPILP